MSSNRIQPAAPARRSQRGGLPVPGAGAGLCLYAVLMTLASAACQPPAVHTRQSIQPSQILGAQNGRPVGVPLQVGDFSVDRIEASAATRHWPLLESHTLSHRYGFQIARDGKAQDVRCVLIRITGDSVRERVSLDCAMGGDDSWHLQLSGRSDLDGALVSSRGDYQVHRAAALRAGKGDDPLASSADYVIARGDTAVAAVVLGGRGEPWIAPALVETDRSAVVATVVALLVGHELGRGWR